MAARFVSHAYHRHAHDTSSFGVTDGAQAFRCRGASHVSHAGQVMTFNPDDPDDPHDGRASGPGGFTYRMVHITPEVVREVCGQRDGVRGLPLFRDPVVDDPVLAARVRRAAAALLDAADPLAVQEAVDALVMAATGHATARCASGPRSGPGGRLPAARGLLHEGFTGPVCADDLARAAAISRFSVYRAFHRRYGMSPSAYLRQVTTTPGRWLPGQVSWTVARAEGVEMPAITVDDVLVLPRLPKLDPAVTAYREARRVITAPSGYEGEGFPVRRAFAGVPYDELDPFIHLDQMGEVEYAPGEPKGTPWHPHRGFETVTYMIDGIFEHQDSNGGGGTITNGDTQWMTAGAGILHIEKPPEHLVTSGGLFHGLQLWVNLPRVKKMAPPRYQDIRGSAATLLTTPDGGALIRVIAGELAGHRGPGVTHTPITIAHVTLEPGAQADLPWRSDYNALVYVLGGKGTVGARRHPLHTGQLAVHGPGDALRVTADATQSSRTPKLDVYVMGGEPIREPVAHYGPFVMNTRAELVQAFEDYQAGRLGTIPAERVPHTSAGENPPA